MRPALYACGARLVFALFVCLIGTAVAQQSPAGTIRVDATAGHAVNSFVPELALGAGVDRLPYGSADKLYSKEVLEPVLSAGWGAVTYRQNTELHVEAWHWNPNGSWSDPRGRGYFTGNATPTDFIRHSYGYPLPHRGVTRNDGTETEGYSRLTDGDPNSYWKSNPYLSQAFTGEDDALHPQWIVVDLGEKRPVNAVRIEWAAPYARAYEVQYWTGEDAIKKQADGRWVAFPSGAITNGAGGVATLQLSAAPIAVRFLRMQMTASSNTCGSHGPSDRRNCVGYAIAEFSAGTLGPNQELNDIVHHVPDQSQTPTYCSSVDPWHEPADLDEHAGDQTGFDLFFTSGITRGLPAMVPIAMLYSTPEDAVAEISYLKKRGYPISYVEMGEEPDGQYMLPEHYAALYLQFAAALHRLDPGLKLGGPVFEGVTEDITVWPDATGKTSWFGRFISHLQVHGRLGDLAFMSFEHYPFEPCNVTWSSLYDEPRLISHIMDVWRKDGLPVNIPMFVTEVNISWQTSELFVDLFGALWQADYLGAFITAGGKGSFYFHYFPMPLHAGCNSSWGAFAMFKADAKFNLGQPVAQYFATQLATQEWVQSGSAPHDVYRASSDIADIAGNTLVTAYALQRPNGLWSLMLVNKDALNSHSVRILFHDAQLNRDRVFQGEVRVASFGRDSYAWHPNAANGHAQPAGPIAMSTERGAGGVYVLPRASITVIRGKVE